MSNALQAARALGRRRHALGRELTWREDAALEVLAGWAPRAAALGPWLWVGDPAPVQATAVWTRLAGPGRSGQGEPPEGPFAAALVRVPRGQALARAVSGLVAGRLEPQGVAWFALINDEGARSLGKVLEAWFESVETAESRRHARVWEARGPRATAPRRLEDLLQSSALVDRQPQLWWSPGAFAQGRLDPGTALLLEHLPEPGVAGPWMDLGAGVGTLASLAGPRGDAWHLLDQDPWALAAAGRNVPEAIRWCRDLRDPIPGGPYAAIVGNPPFHQGVALDAGLVAAVLEGAARALLPGGELRWVTLASLRPPSAPRAPWVGPAEQVAARGGYVVWRLLRS